MRGSGPAAPYGMRVVLPLLFTLLLVLGTILWLIQSQGVYIERHPPPQGPSPGGRLFRIVYLEKPTDGSSARLDLRHSDLSALNLSDKLDVLLSCTFDSTTRWPPHLPAAFDPLEVMERNKDPGLGIRALHARGITGKGVGIAVIDYPLLTRHAEYRSRLKRYEEILAAHHTAHMHGTAMSSIAVGESTGVAPAADLYFMGTFNMSQAAGKPVLDFSSHAAAIQRLLEINREIPSERKIRVISISASWAPGNRGYEAMQEAVREARSQGVLVVSSNLFETTGFRFFFHGLDRDPLSDPDDPASYRVIAWEEWISLLGEERFPDFIRHYEKACQEQSGSEMLLVPVHSKTVAAPTGADDYTFFRHGGWSDVPPYLAGLYALACQVDPHITPDSFWRLALDTGFICDVTRQERKWRGKAIHPLRLIEALEQGRNAGFTRP